jgi:hypothetical protein
MKNRNKSLLYSGGDDNMFNNKLKKNIKACDEAISMFTKELKSSKDPKQQKICMDAIDYYTKQRGLLSEQKVRESHAPAIISGVIGLGAIILVLRYEKVEVITSKGFGMATKFIRGI